MSKFEIRSPLLITAALALTPAIAFAGSPAAPESATTTTTTTTVPSDNPSSPARTSSGTVVPSEMDANRVGVAPPSEPAIDPGQVQRVFGMDVSLIDLKTLNDDQIKQLQQRLTERGFYRGKVDGKMGPQTKSALSGLMAQQFALNQRLVGQGQITEQFATSIGLDTAGRAPVSGVDQMAPSAAPRANPPAARSNEPPIENKPSAPPPNQ